MPPPRRLGDRRGRDGLGDRVHSRGDRLLGIRPVLHELLVSAPTEHHLVDGVEEAEVPVLAAGVGVIDRIFATDSIRITRLLREIQKTHGL